MQIGDTENNTNSFNTSDADTLDTSVVQVAYSEADAKLVEFVNKNIQLMQDHLIQSEYPDIASINKAYIDYMPISLSLNRLYQKVKLDAAKAQEDLNLFDDQAIEAARLAAMQVTEKQKTIKVAAAELKAYAHTKYKTKYAQLRAKVDLAEGRRSFIERLCRAWDTWQYGLGQISRNLIAEANANGLDMKAQSVMPIDPDDRRIENVVDQALLG